MMRRTKRPRNQRRRGSPLGGAAGSRGGGEGAEAAEARRWASKCRRSKTDSRRSGGRGQGDERGTLRVVAELAGVTELREDTGRRGVTEVWEVSAALSSSWRRRRRSAVVSARCRWRRRKKRWASPCGQGTDNSKDAGMRAARRGMWHACKTSFEGKGIETPEDCIAACQASLMFSTQEPAPVAGQRATACTSSSSAAPQHKQAAEGTWMGKWR